MNKRATAKTWTQTKREEGSAQPETQAQTLRGSRSAEAEKNQLLECIPAIYPSLPFVFLMYNRPSGNSSSINQFFDL